MADGVGRVVQPTRVMAGIRLPWRYDVSLRPDGLLLSRRRRTELLTWAEHGGVGSGSADGWRVLTRFGGRGDRSIIIRHGRRRTNVSRWFSPVSAEATAALLEFLAATPKAQARLATRDDLVPLLRGVKQGLPLPRVPSGPLLHSGGRNLAILRCLDDVWPRRFGGYPVEGEPRPAVDAVVAALILQAPVWFTSTPELQLVKEVERHLAVGAWTFASLCE